MIELRHLRYFLAVAEEMNFTKAANRLHVAQPPLSVQIRDLEEMIGVPLLDRSSRPFQLTEAGLYLKEECRRLLGETDTVIEQTRRVGKGRKGWIGIGFIPSTLHGFLSGLLAEFRKSNPDIEVVLRAMSRSEQVEALHTRRIHVGILRPKLETEEFVQTLVHRDTIAFACPEDHRFAKKKAVALSELSGENFIAYDSGNRPSFFLTFIAKACQEAGFEPRITMEVDQPITAMSAVSAGFGVSLVASSLAAARIAGCKIIPLAEPVPQNPIYAIYRRGETADSFRKFMAALERFESH